MFSITDWSRVREKSDDEDTSDINIVAGFLVTPGLTTLDGPPPPIDESGEDDASAWEGRKSPNADKAWQRRLAANQERLAALESSFTEAHEARRARDSARMREQTTAYLATPRGSERAMGMVLEAHGECFPGVTETVIRREREENGKPREPRPRAADSETKAIRTALGLEGSSEVSFPTWMRDLRKQRRIPIPGDVKGRVMDWNVMFRKIQARPDPSKRLQMWNTACKRVFRLMGLGRAKPTLQPSCIEGRTGVCLYTSTSTSAHNPGPIATPQPRSPLYRPNRDSLTADLAEVFKADAEAGRELFRSVRLPHGHFGPLQRQPIVTRCKLSGRSLVERDDARRATQARIEGLRLQVRNLTHGAKGGVVRIGDAVRLGTCLPPDEDKARKASARLVAAERRLAKPSKSRFLWRIKPHLNGYDREAVRTLLTAAAGISGMDPDVTIDYDPTDATPSEREHYNMAERLASDPDAFCTLAVAVRHPDYSGPAAAAMALRDFWTFDPIDI